MKSVLTAKLVHTNDDPEYNGLKRFYKLSHKINKGAVMFDNNVVISEEVLSVKFKPEYQFLQDALKEGTDIILVSDAHTHIERLVFAGISYEENGETKYGSVSVQIGGKHTYLTEGGDKEACYEPEVYIRRLCQLNGYIFGGIIDD